MMILSPKTRFSTPSAATIGCFDGVHRGHQMLVQMMVCEARQRGLKPIAVTFDRLPRQLFDSNFHPQVLSTLDEKVTYLKELGVEEVMVLPFTHQLAAFSAEAFMKEILRDQLSVELLVIGYDNRFGRDRSEGFDDYVRYGQRLGIDVVRGDVAMMDDQMAVSSTVIRQLLAEEGRVEAMPDVLTRRYTLSGHVVSGEHIGHELGFPTANLEPDSQEKLIPASGAYAVWAMLDSRIANSSEQRMPAMMNIGTRPTFEGKQQTLEVHILKDVGNLYGQEMMVEFVSRLRAEQRFDTREALIAQLEHDKQTTEEILLNDK
jgi:riboflavin kinase/FMN adenylyltransferase